MNIHRAKFVLFGDSLTQRGFQEGGWCGRLAAVHESTADVVLRGYWGYNSRWAVQLLPHVFPSGSRAPNLVTILLGSNDAVLPGLTKAESKQHVPLDEYKQNLTAIIQHIRSLEPADHAEPCSILLITPPPIDHDKWQRFRMDTFVPPPPPVRNRDLEHTKQYAEAAMQVGRETQTATLDLFTILTRDHSQWKEYLLDGLHFNPEGNRVLFECLKNASDAHYPHLRRTALTTQFPEFGDIDPENYLQAFVTNDKSINL